MFKALLFSLVFHGALLAAGLFLWLERPRRPTILYVEPVWELASGDGGVGVGSEEEAVEGATVSTPLLEGNKSSPSAVEKPSTKKNRSASSGAAHGARRVQLDDFLRGTGNKAPRYPEEALARGLEGEVSMDIRFVDGKPQLSVLRSSGHAVLDNEVLRTLSSWRLPDEFADDSDPHFQVPVEFKLVN